jgi:hypothetical protein
MTENTIYENFNIYLKKYIGQKINCLVIGADTGKYSSWLLNNLCTNLFSRVFSLDNWTDSIIEQDFDSQIESTDKIDYHVKLNMNLTKGLVRLEKIKYVIFDIIIINTKQEYDNLISNLIIAWNLLNENGIMIFDYYKKSNIVYAPKISLKSFIIMYREYFNLLSSNDQYIIEKKSNILSKNKEKDIIKIIDNYNFYKLYIIFDEEFDEELEFRFANIDLNKDMNKLNENFNYIMAYDMDLLKNEDYVRLDKNIQDKFKQYITEYNIKINNINFSLYYEYSNFYDYFIKKYKNYKHIFINCNNLDKNNFNLLFQNVNFESKFHISFNKLEIKEEVYQNIINHTKKYDLIFFSYPTNINTYNLNYYLYYIGIAINIQNKNGTLLLIIPFLFNINILCEMICLLNKYYNKVTIINKNPTLLGTFIYIKCKYFKNITQDYTQLDNFIFELLTKKKLSFNSILNLNNKLSSNLTSNLMNKLKIYSQNMITLINKHKIIYKYNNDKIIKLFIYRLIYLYLLAGIK